MTSDQVHIDSFSWSDILHVVFLHHKKSTALPDHESVIPPNRCAPQWASSVPATALTGSDRL